MSDDFDLAHDKLPDQPVTIGGDKSAAAWHGADADYAATLARIDRLTRERDEARAERDALAHVIAKTRAWHMEQMGTYPRLIHILESVPANLLALHDAEVKAQALEELQRRLVQEGELPLIVAGVIAEMVTAIRSEAL